MTSHQILARIRGVEFLSLLQRITMTDEHTQKVPDLPTTTAARAPALVPDATLPREIGGPKGLEPTRYGDWERKGRCVDF